MARPNYRELEAVQPTCPDCDGLPDRVTFEHNICDCGNWWKREYREAAN